MARKTIPITGTRRKRVRPRSPGSFRHGPSAAFLFFLWLLLPDLLVAARLELRHGLTGPSEVTALVGDEFEVVLWVDSEGEMLSGATIFLTFSESAFELVPEDRDPGQSGYQPFAPGSFLRNGDKFRNTVLDATDPAASPSGAQLDYSVVRTRDRGEGPVASFRLRAKAPVHNSVIRIDESGIRETRFFLPDGTNGAFRFITPLRVDVQGIGIEGLPERLVLTRGQVDTTTFRLDTFIFDPLFGPREISWTISPTSSLVIDHDLDLNRLSVTAPAADSPWERLTLTARNPDGQTATASIDIFVNEGPTLSETIPAIRMEEDGAFDLDLDDLVEDPDTPRNRLRWSEESPRELSVSIEGPPYVAHLEPAADWNGEGEVSFVVVDEFDFADTTTVAVSVAAVNDAPRMLTAPNVRLIRGRRDSSLVLGQLMADAEDGLDELELLWTGADRVEIERRGGRLVLSAPAVWLGTETIQLEVTDREGLTASAPLTVTVIQSLPPAVVDPPRRLGLPPGEETIIDLQSLVVDPDDPSSALQWRASGQEQLLLQLSSAGAARIEAPVGFSGSEVVRFEVTDPSGEKAFFELLVFAASAGGEPTIAPLPAIELPLGGVDASLDLDDYVFDLDHDPSSMEWFLPATEGLELRVDPVSHVLTVTASDSARTGDRDLQLRVRDPDGNESTQILTLRIPAAPGDPPPVDDPQIPPVDDPEISPVLAPLPTLRLVAGSFDQSLVLDDYLSGIDPASISWEVEGQRHVEVLVDPESRRVTVLADADWSGPEIILFRGEDEFGHSVEGMLGVQILPDTSELSLREMTEVSVLAGDRQFELDLSALLDGDGDRDRLEWEVRASRVYTVTYDGEANTLKVTADAIPQGDQVLTLVVRDGAGEELTGVVVVHAHPVDGSFGADSDDLSIAVLPNPVQPDYLDIFVISDLATERIPRLRLQDGDWTDLPVQAGQPGIWHGSHVLAANASGDIRFLALTMKGQEVLKADFTLVVTPAPSNLSPKTSVSAQPPGAMR